LKIAKILSGKCPPKVHDSLKARCMLRRFGALWLALVLGTFPAASHSMEAVELDLPPRVQWNANYGYCGEMSLVSAGLFYGQYCSQYTARALASPGMNQASARSQLLLGVNDLLAARRMRLAAEPCPRRGQKSSADFLAWVKSEIQRGHPVVIGLFCNARRFGRELPGDDEYDHIVLVRGVATAASSRGADAAFQPNDRLLFNDHGLYTRMGRPVHQFAEQFASLLKNRSAANAVEAPIYSLKSTPRNYGLAITGVADPGRVTIPVRLATSLNQEPTLAERSKLPPAPVPLEITATVSIPDPTQAYTLYRYDDFAEVPTRGFNARAARAAQSWTIPPGSGRTYAVTYLTDTSATVVFRAVPVSAP
jgi:hypothetical protein